MIIQKVGPDSIVIVAENRELGADIAHCARLALNEAGIDVAGFPHCDAYTLGNETLLFASAHGGRVYYKFECADDLIDAARLLGNDLKYGKMTLLCGKNNEYIIETDKVDYNLNEYAQPADAPPKCGYRRLAADAIKRLGK